MITGERKTCPGCILNMALARQKRVRAAKERELYYCAHCGRGPWDKELHRWDGKGRLCWGKPDRCWDQWFWGEYKRETPAELKEEPQGNGLDGEA